MLTCICSVHVVVRFFLCCSNCEFSFELVIVRLLLCACMHILSSRRFSCMLLTICAHALSAWYFFFDAELYIIDDWVRDREVQTRPRVHVS